jgi:hypothetical protein
MKRVLFPSVLVVDLEERQGICFCFVELRVWVEVRVLELFVSAPISVLEGAVDLVETIPSSCSLSLLRSQQRSGD